MATPDTIRLAAVGDIALDAGYGDLLRQGKAHEVFAGVAPYFAGADLLIGNLEGPLTTAPSASPPWRHTLHGDPGYAPVLRSAGFHVLSLANNHMMDYGWPGVEETIEKVTAQGIQVVGAGKNLEEARRPAMFVAKGVRVAVLAYCSVAVRNPLYASTGGPGIAPAQDSFIEEDVLKAKKEADIVVVCLHWGQELVGYPAPRFCHLARHTISAGASLIIGHHPHVLQGVEKYKQGLVAYSLGNFTFAEEMWKGADQKGNSFTMHMRIGEASRRTAILKSELTRAGKVVKHEVIPAYLGTDLRVIPDPNPQRTKQMESMSKPLNKSGYAMIWLGLMFMARARVVKGQIFGGRSFWSRLYRLRPHHLREAFKILGREWEQYRGTK